MSARRCVAIPAPPGRCARQKRTAAVTSRTYSLPPPIGASLTFAQSPQGFAPPSGPTCPPLWPAQAHHFDKARPSPTPGVIRLFRRGTWKRGSPARDRGQGLRAARRRSRQLARVARAGGWSTPIPNFAWHSGNEAKRPRKCSHTREASGWWRVERKAILVPLSIYSTPGRAKVSWRWPRARTPSTSAYDQGPRLAARQARLLLEKGEFGPRRRANTPGAVASSANPMPAPLVFAARRALRAQPMTDPIQNWLADLIRRTATREQLEALAWTRGSPAQELCAPRRRCRAAWRSAYCSHLRLIPGIQMRAALMCVPGAAIAPSGRRPSCPSLRPLR